MLSAILMVLLGSVMPTAKQAALPPPNILVIVLDDVGKEHLACYGGADAVPTPSLDLFAKWSVLFDEHYAMPICAPTRAALLTGRLPFRTGVGAIPGVPPHRLHPLEVTIADALPAGYATAAFGKWHLTHAADVMHPVQLGFDTFWGPLGNVFDHYSWDRVASTAAGSTTAHIGSASGPFDETTFATARIFAEAAAWVRAAPEPWFAYVNPLAPHAPFQVPPLSLLSPGTQAQVAQSGYVPGQNIAA